MVLLRLVCSVIVTLMTFDKQLDSRQTEAESNGSRMTVESVDVTNPLITTHDQQLSKSEHTISSIWLSMLQ